MQVEAFLESSASRLPWKVALICGDRRLTYAELDCEAERVAALLRANGVCRGDRVVIQLDNGVEAVVALFAVLKAGAVFVLVNPSVKAAKLQYLLNNSAAIAFVADSRRLQPLQPLWSATPHLSLVVTVGEAAEAAGCGKTVVPFAARATVPLKPQAEGIDADLAALIYTSGSTGEPKGVMLTHLNMVSAATSITGYLDSRESDIILNMLPLSFDYGLYQVLMAFKTGATVVVERSFTYPHAVLDTIARERVTGFPIVPTIAAILCQLDLEAYDLRSVRYITNTGAALPTQHVRRLRATLPQAQIFLMYGLTECKRVSYLPPAEIDARPDSVGRGMPNQEVYLVDEQDKRLTSGVGELVVRGSHVMRGYWRAPLETDRVLKPGPVPGERVLYTGDIFRMDEHGFLYFVGRKDDIIKTRGEKVSPKEVENVLCGLEGVAQAAIVGVPDPLLGEAVKAVVSVREGVTLTAAEVRRHCARHLEDFMVPKIVEFRASLPLTASGKVDRRRLFEVAG